MLDSHCHINDERLFDERETVVNEAKAAGVSTFLCVGWDLESSKKALVIAHQFEGVYAAIGFHPENLETISDEALAQIRRMAADSKVVAIGEIGLDYYWYKESENHLKQKAWFNKQIELANELNLPLSIHSRDASEDTYAVLSNNPPRAGFVLHCYSGSAEMMDRFVGLGSYFGFDGPITYKNSVVPKENVKRCPVDRILTETDAPYLTPVPFRGQRNEPKYIPHILQAMAELRGVSLEQMEKNVNNNFESLFRIPK